MSAERKQSLRDLKLRNYGPLQAARRNVGKPAPKLVCVGRPDLTMGKLLGAAAAAATTANTSITDNNTLIPTRGALNASRTLL